MVLGRHRAGCEMSSTRRTFDDEMTDEAKQIFPPNADKSILGRDGRVRSFKRR
jgi:N-acetylneuraminate synthase